MMLEEEREGDIESWVDQYINSFGWRAIPVGRNKVPLVKWRGISHDEARKAWDSVRNGCYGIALITGSDDNLFVIDVDPRNGGSLDRIGFKPEEATVISHSGGYHIYSYVPDWSILRCVLDQGIHRKPVDGIDLLYDGAIVIAPPTIGAAGRYKICSGRVYIDDERIISFVSRFAAAISGRCEERGHGGTVLTLKNVSAVPVSVGERHNAALRYAGRLFYQGVSYDGVLYSLLLWNRENNPPMDDREIRRIVKDIYEKEKKKRGNKKDSR